MTRANVANFFTTNLSAQVADTDLTFPVDTTVDGPASPCYIVIEPEEASRREIVWCDGTFSASQFVTTSASNRYLEGSAQTSGIVHPSGSPVWAAIVGQHIDDVWDAIDAIGAKADDPHGDAAHNALSYADDPHGDAAHSNDYAALEVAANNQTGTTYTLVLADAGKVVELNNAGAITLTVPPNSSVAFPVGTVIEVWQQGAGQVTVAAGAGVTIRSPGGLLSLDGQYATATLRKRATDTWALEGRLV